MCDAWSCEQCRLVRGDGEEVASLVDRLRPRVVLLDFDRTLASTKAGADPLLGAQTVDPDLFSMACAHPAVPVYVVTRNGHREAIEEFLRRQGMPVQGVRSVKLEGRSKADVIGELLDRHCTGGAAEGAAGLFVDDDIRELEDARLQGDTRLLRVLFVRAL